MKELLKDYLRTIKGIQECDEMGVSPYSLNNERIRLHKKIADRLGLKGEAETVIQTAFLVWEIKK